MNDSVNDLTSELKFTPIPTTVTLVSNPKELESRSYPLRENMPKIGDKVSWEQQEYDEPIILREGFITGITPKKEGSTTEYVINVDVIE